MKLAFENGTAVPPATPSKKGASASDSAAGASSTKRKRGAATAAGKKSKKMTEDSDDEGNEDGNVDVKKEEGDDGDADVGQEEEEEEEKPKAKRARNGAAKKTATPKKKAATKKSKVKAEEYIQDELHAEHEEAKPIRSLIDQLDDVVEEARATYHRNADGAEEEVYAEDEDDLVQASKHRPFPLLFLCVRTLANLFVWTRDEGERLA